MLRKAVLLEPIGPAKAKRNQRRRLPVYVRDWDCLGFRELCRVKLGKSMNGASPALVSVLHPTCQPTAA